MKKLSCLTNCFILLLFLFSHKAYSQCAGSSTGSPIDAGTLGPGNSFTNGADNSNTYCFTNQIGQPSSEIYYRFTLNTTGQVNISHCGSGFDTYMHLLDQNGSELSFDDDNGPLCSGLCASISQVLSAGTYFVVSEGYGGNTGYITTSISVASGSGSCTAGDMWTCSGGNVFNANGGNVGIGTTDTKGYKFAVNGSAIFTSVNVKTYTNWPDYVFSSSYKLKPLSQIHKFITQYHRLPGLPSADEVKEKGMKLEENQSLLLQKIEELTLYVIEQNKKQEELTKQVNAQFKKIEELQSRLNNTEKKNGINK
jgi:hypothetical protein